MAIPMTAPTRTQIAPPSAEAAAAWPVRKSEVSTPSRMTATNARTARAVADPLSMPGPPQREAHRGRCDAWRRIQNSIQVTTEGGDDHRQRFEELPHGSWKLPTVLEQDDAEQGAQPEREAGAEEDPREVAGVAGLGQVGADDGDDQGGFDAFAQAREQSGGMRRRPKRAPFRSSSRSTMVSKGA